MKTIFRAVFYLRSNYVNKEGKTPVMLRIYLNNERLSIGSTGIAVQQSQWDSEKERLKGRTTEVLSTNLELDNIQSGLQTIFKKLEMTDAISLFVEQIVLEQDFPIKTAKDLHREQLIEELQVQSERALREYEAGEGTSLDNMRVRYGL